MLIFVWFRNKIIIITNPFQKNESSVWQLSAVLLNDSDNIVVVVVVVAAVVVVVIGKWLVAIKFIDGGDVDAVDPQPQPPLPDDNDSLIDIERFRS